MMSLKAKVTAALLATSFAAIALFGITARGMILSRFDDMVLDRAFAGFSQDIAAYYEYYGSWKAAAAAESFPEFVIAFPETPIEEAVGLTERLRVAIKEHPWTDIHPELAVTISMGLSADEGLASFEEMLAAAGEQLYRAKESRRDRVYY